MSGMPTSKMERFAKAIYKAGYQPQEGMSISDVLSDFTLCFSYIGRFKDSYLREMELRKHNGVDPGYMNIKREEERQRRIYGSPETEDMMRDAFEFDSETMREYFGSDSVWRWDGL